MKTFLELALSDKDLETGARAFMLLGKVASPVLEMLFHEDLFLVHTTEVLFSDKPNMCLISRVATLLGNILSSFPGKSAECCGFIFKIVEFAGEPGVFDLLHRICENNGKMEATQASLVEAGFADLLISTLERDDLDEHAVAGIFRIIREAAENTKMKDSIRTNKMIRAIRIHTKSKSTHVLNELWRALASVTYSGNGEEAATLVPIAIDHVSDFYTTVLRHHIFAVEFLSKMMALKSDGMRTCLDHQLQEVILRLIVQFPESSNLMGSVFRFLRAAFQWDEFISVMADKFIPVLVAVASAKQRTAASAQSMSILADLKNRRAQSPLLTKALEKFDEFYEFTEGILSWRNAVMTLPYGGPFEQMAIHAGSYMSF